MDIPSFTASAPGKIILCGEHAVVYGYPAIALPISTLRAYAEVQSSQVFEIIAEDIAHTIHLSDDSPIAQLVHMLLEKVAHPMPRIRIRLYSEIPIASGLGSGAAISTAIARAVLHALQVELDLETLNQIIFTSEKYYHGTPSGIDNSVIVYEKPVYFVKDKTIEFINVPLSNTYTIIVADTGKLALTKESVAKVRELYMKNPHQISSILENIGEIVKAIRVSLERNDYRSLGVLMSNNHKLLQQLQVSSQELDKLVFAALSAGAIGAKLSGGGQGGHMIALVSEDKQGVVEKALLEAGANRIVSTTLGRD